MNKTSISLAFMLFSCHALAVDSNTQDGLCEAVQKDQNSLFRSITDRGGVSLGSIYKDVTCEEGVSLMRWAVQNGSKRTSRLIMRKVPTLMLDVNGPDGKSDYQWLTESQFEGDQKFVAGSFIKKMGG